MPGDDALEIVVTDTAVGSVDSFDHVRNTALLDAELPDPRFVDGSYLHWLYDQNPAGPGIFGNIDDAGVRVGHYALIPQKYRDASGPAPFVFSLNAVARAGYQRRGFFRDIGNRIWTRAQDHGVKAVVGVTNAKSTGAVKKCGWRVMGPMPVKVVVPDPRRPRNVESFDVTEAFLASDTFAAASTGLDAAPAWHWTSCWSPEQLRWRLTPPNHTRYSLHVTPELIGVSAATKMQGVPFAVVLKLLPRGGRFGPLSSRSILAAMCRHHGAPFAVYAGNNRHVPVHGFPLPERLKPVPLNLCMLSLTDEIDQNTFQLDTFEFLDMDGY